MKSYFTITIILFIVFISNTANSQEKYFSVFAELGSASASTGGLNVAGGGGSLGPWKAGVQISLGIEYPLDRHFSARGILNYSYHGYNNFYTREFWNNNPSFTMLDLWSDLKLNIWKFFLHLGAGVSSQNGQEILLLDENGKHYPSYESPRKSKLHLSSLIGLGIDVHIYDRFGIIGEANILMREYAAASASIGIKYRLN